MAATDIDYFEDLAATGIICPHEDAFVPDGETIFFRYIKGGDVASDSFLPTQLKTDRPLPKECDACVQKSVSVYNDLNGLINGLFRLPFNRGKKKTICLLKLTPNDGMLKQTFGPNHHSWWRSKAFDIATVTVKEIEV